MRVALYARVSTTEQTLEPQLHALREYAKARGFDVRGEYHDPGVSGARDRRPALDELMSEARRRRFDVLAVVKLDRLARSVRHLTSLAGELEALGIDLVAVDQAIDTTTPAGRLLFHVLGSIAEFERDLIRERTRAGMAAAKRRGKHVGRPRALNRDQAERLTRLYRLGQSMGSIGRTLGVSRATVAREIGSRRRPR